MNTFRERVTLMAEDMKRDLVEWRRSIVQLREQADGLEKAARQTETELAKAEAFLTDHTIPKRSPGRPPRTRS